MFVFSLVMVGLITSIILVLQIREKKRLEATVYLLVKEQHKSKNVAYWNKQAQFICSMPRSDIQTYITSTAADKYYSDGHMVVFHAKCAGMNLKADWLSLKAGANQAAES